MIRGGSGINDPRRADEQRLDFIPEIPARNKAARDKHQIAKQL